MTVPRLFPQSNPIRIAVVGDVHEAWDSDDALALQHLGVDLVLLVGDFGNESVPTVQAIAALDLPKAVILGNHDAWYTASEWGRKKSPYDHRLEDRVQQQLDVLGDVHVGYGKLDFPHLGLTVVGSRPFSWGGTTWKNEQFYRDRYGIHNYEESTARMMAAVEAAAHETIIFLAHCGPFGLGDRPDDPCGRDWQPMGGDYGDPDLTAAIAQARQAGKQIPLVAFGHMHHRLRHLSTHRTTLRVDNQAIVYLNAAMVPRIVQTDRDRLHHFALVELHDQRVSRVAQVWVNRAGAIATETVLYGETSDRIYELLG